MKKLFFGVITLTLLSVSAYAAYGILEWEELDGMNRICHYTNGTTIIVKSSGNCPLSSH